MAHRLGKRREAEECRERRGVLHAIDHVVEYFCQSREVLAVDRSHKGAIDFGVQPLAHAVCIRLEWFESSGYRRDLLACGRCREFPEDVRRGVDLARKFFQETEELVPARQQEPDKPVN
jgi:hypothetical protein